MHDRARALAHLVEQARRVARGDGRAYACARHQRVEGVRRPRHQQLVALRERAVAADDSSSRGAVAEHDPLGLDPEAAASRRRTLLGVPVRLAVQRPRARDDHRVDDLGVRQVVPLGSATGRVGTRSSALPPSRGGAARALSVTSSSSARRTAGSSPRKPTEGSAARCRRRTRPLDEQEPDREDDDARSPRRRRRCAPMLPGPGGARRRGARASTRGPAAWRAPSSSSSEAEAAEHDGGDADADVVGQVVDLGADPQPGQRLRPEQRQAEHELDGEQTARRATRPCAGGRSDDGSTSRYRTGACPGGGRRTGRRYRLDRCWPCARPLPETRERSPQRCRS